MSSNSDPTERGALGEVILPPIMIPRRTVSDNAARPSTSTPMNDNANESTAKTPVTMSQSEVNDYLRSMKNGRKRLSTFTSGRWPLLYLSPVTMAEAGFFYLNEHDRVQCAFCQLKISNWVQGDVPIMEHMNHNPGCRFIQGHDVGNIPLEDDPVRGRNRMLPRTFDVCGNYNSRRGLTEPITLSSDEEEDMYISDTDDDMETPNRRPMPVSTGNDYNNVNTYNGSAVALHGPRFPMYVTAHARKQTYPNSWPSRCPISAEKLAEAGFFCSSYPHDNDDRVSCFSCGGGLCNWEPTDDPWREHKRLYPNCPFVRLNMSDVPEITITETNETADEMVDEWLKSDIVLELLQNNRYSNNVVKNVLRQKYLSDHRPFNSVDELKAELEKASHNPLTLGRHTSVSSDEGYPCSSQESEFSTSPEGSSSDEERAQRATCKVCLDKEVSVLFLPCTHLICCSTCAPALNSCPYCRGKIDQAIVTRFA
ncbi:Death-associated inhibitor of apoptosis 1 [Halotydeus destructor]|nr:Death-associated inhibitor of apoptosis 1 [Halotydeus destructor]